VISAFNVLVIYRGTVVTPKWLQDKFNLSWSDVFEMSMRAPLRYEKAVNITKCPCITFSPPPIHTDSQTIVSVILLYSYNYMCM
jgi:hypothetical protein